ncbi:hypothetical protein V6N11_054855 [Hibiscus sabdariffa]|uniref:Uncharacterized protein n=1 Tax=Hibiscus sabdariffa TaxID=183260 RepID=A0ABR2P341_9ROSI
MHEAEETEEDTVKVSSLVNMTVDSPVSDVNPTGSSSIAVRIIVNVAGFRSWGFSR